MPPKNRNNNNNNNNNNRLFPNVRFVAGHAVPGTLPQSVRLTGDPTKTTDFIENARDTLIKMFKTYQVSMGAYDPNNHGVSGLPLNSDVDAFRCYRVIVDYLKDRFNGAHKLFLSDGHRVKDAPLLLYHALVDDMGTDVTTTFQGGVPPLHFTAGAHPASALGASAWLLASMCQQHMDTMPELDFVDLDVNAALDSVNTVTLDNFLSRVLFQQDAPALLTDPMGSYSPIEKYDSSANVVVTELSKTGKPASYLGSVFVNHGVTLAHITTGISFGGVSCYVVGCGLVKLVHPGRNFLTSSEANAWFFTCAGFPDPSVLFRDTSLNPEVYACKVVNHKNGTYSTENIIDIFITHDRVHANKLVSEVETMNLMKMYRQTFGSTCVVLWNVVKWFLYVGCTLGSLAMEFVCLWFALYYQELVGILFSYDAFDAIRGSWVGTAAWGLLVGIHFAVLILIALVFLVVFMLCLKFRNRVGGWDPPYTRRLPARVRGFSSGRIPQTSDRFLDLGGGPNYGTGTAEISSSGSQRRREERSEETRHSSQEEVVRFNAKSSSVPDHSNARASSTPKAFYDSNMQRLLNQFEPRRCSLHGLHHVPDFEDADDELRTKLLGNDWSGYWPFSLTQKCLEAGLTESDFVDTSGKTDTIKTIQGMLHYKNRRYENGVEMPRELNGSAFKDAQTFWNSMNHGLLSSGYFDGLQPRSLAGKIKVGNDGKISGPLKEALSFIDEHRKQTYSYFGVQPPDTVSPDHPTFGVIEKYYFNWYAKVEDRQNPYSLMTEASEKEFAHAVIQHKYHRETKYSDQITGAFNQVWSKRRDNPGKPLAVKVEEEFNKRKSGNVKGMMA